MRGSMTPRAAPISAKAPRTASICSSVWAALTLARSSGKIYLEIRRGTEALDPADWLEKR